MTQETALSAALKSAVQTMSKQKQTNMIAGPHLIRQIPTPPKRFKPAGRRHRPRPCCRAALNTTLPLIARVPANHCRRPRTQSPARGGKRFDLNNRSKGEVSGGRTSHRLKSTRLSSRLWQNKPSAKRAKQAAKTEAVEASKSA